MDRRRRNAEPPELVGVALAAGEGRRLAPLSEHLAKALCPVGNRALLDLALDRLEHLGVPLAVNLHHRADEVRRHLERSGRGVHLSLEEPEALGTAGALGALKGWIDGRAAVVVNADTWVPGGLEDLLAGWDEERPRVMVQGPASFGPRAGLVASVTPWAELRDLPATPSGLYEVLWGRCHEEGRLDVVGHVGPFVDCGTPTDYLEANLRAAGLVGGAIVDPGARLASGSVEGRSVVGAGAVVEGRVRDSVVWPGARVAADELLERSVRVAPGVTVGPLRAGSAPTG